MTIQDVEARVAHIRSIAFDPEKAHEAEDFLHKEVLHAIARGEDGGNPAALARAALATRDIEFERWCA